MSNAVASSSRPKEHKSKHSSKHKDRDASGVGKKHKKRSKPAAGSEGSPFELRVARMRLSVAPRFAGDWLAGVRETLDGMLMRYMPEMGGVLLAHWEHGFLDDTVQIINECPFGVCEVEFHSIVWAPQIGQVLTGTHSLSSPSHLSLLFSKTFNVSIPLQHIPLDTYEFEHTDGAADKVSSDSDSEDDDDGELGVHEVGRWKDRQSGRVLGEGGEAIKFTVIGMQVVNHVLTLTGSLLSDPSNPPALPEPARRSPSPELDLRPAKQARVAAPTAANGTGGSASSAVASAKRATKAVAPASALVEPDYGGMTARDAKKARKEYEKARRDERKARKGRAGGGDGGDGDAEDEVKDEDEAEAEPVVHGKQAKRKAEGEGGERKKKRKD
ncbi:hypothetical protein Q5752_006499 [Cryptotrichosporon argae]